MNPLKPPFPRGYDLNARCDYHASVVSHSTENYKALKYKLQNLINAKWLSFEDDSPNVRSNPLPSHGRPSVNAIEETFGCTLRKNVEDIKTSLRVIFEEMCKFGLIEGSFDNNYAFSLHPDAGHAIEHCDVFKQILQGLIDRNFIQVGYISNHDVVAVDDLVLTFPKSLVIHYTKGMTNAAPSGPKPITIQIPRPSPYKDNKTVPWRYDVEVCTNNPEENHVKNASLKISNVTNIAGVRGLTCSGRIYAPDDLRVKETKDTTKNKEKEVTMEEMVDEKKE